MKKYYISLLSLMLSVTINSYAQNDWASMMRNPTVNVHDVQKAFNTWLNSNSAIDSNEDEENGTSLYKQWEWMMGMRTYPTGNRPDPVTIANDYNTFLHTTAHRSTHSAATWSYVGNTSVPPNIPSDGNNGGDGRVSHLRYYPGNNSIMFACCPTGGLWKTTNGGSSWSTVTDQLEDIATSDVAINPLKPNVMYLATGDGDGINSIYTTVTTIGVLKSTDGGNTWSATGLSYTLASSGPSYATINNILINPSDTSIVVAATSFGIYYSSNSGASWTQSVSEDFMSMVMEPSHPSRIYASTFDGKFYTSADGGKTFTQTTSGLPASGIAGRMAVAVSAADTNDVYVLATDPTYYAFYGLYLSTNHGASFTAKSTAAGGAPNILGRSQTGNDPTVGQGWYDLSMDVSPTNIDSVVVGGINIWLTGNAGTSWTLNAEWTGSGAPYVHADVHSIEFMPGHSSTYIATCDGGVFETTNYGSSWTDLSNNLEIAQQYCVGPSSKTANKFITGWQDNGTNLASSGSWTQNVGGDGMVCFIDYSTDNNMYAENPDGALSGSTNGGANWSTITSGITESGPWVTQWMQDPKSSNTLFAGFNNVWKSTNKGSSWTAISSWSSASITALAVDSSNDNYIYAAQAGKLEYTSNGGTTWTNITGTLPTGSAAISAITVNPKNPTHIWVTFSGYSSGNKVYQSYNSGGTWTNISTGLPNLPVNAICYQPGTLEALYIGTDQGVYYHDTINGWVSYNTGLPNVMIGDVKVAKVNKTLLAATYGRGTWQSNLFSNPSSSAPVAYFTASTTTVCAGGSVTFTDTSTGSPTSWAWTFTGGTPGTSILQNPTVVYNTPGSYAVKLVVKNSNGSDSLTKTTYITVNAIPTVSGSASPATICAGSSTSLSGSGATTYTWAPNTALSATTGSPVTSTTTGSLTYTVTGTTSGCSATATVAVTVNPSPTVVASAAPSSICAGGSTTVSASGASSYTWAPNTALSATTGNSVTANPGSTITYTVTGTTAGCSGSQTVSVTVNAIPTPTVTPSSASICSGSNTTLTASGGTTYTWSPSAGLSATTGTSVTAGPGATQTYTLTGTTAGCSGTTTATVTVNATPTVTASATATTICSGSSTTLSSSGATTYSWSPNTALSATTGTPVTATPASTITYSVTGTTAGCTSAVKTVAITVNPTPTVNVSPASPSVCSGVGAVLTASGATTYTWSPNTALTATTGASVTADPGTTTTYTVTGTKTGCTSTQSVVVSINATPTVVVTPSGPTTFCSGNSVGLTATGATTYSWAPATGLSVTTGGTVTASPSATTTYTVTGSNGTCTDKQTIVITVTASPTVSVTPASANICTGIADTLKASGATSYTWFPSAGLNVTTGAVVAANPIVTTTYSVAGVTGACSDTLLVVVTVGSPPVITVTPPTDSVCTGGNVSLTASGATTYTWLPKTSLSATTGATVTSTPAATITYTVTGTSGGCTGTQTVTVKVNTLPVITISPTTATICSGTSTTLTASGGVSYTWSPATSLNVNTGAVVIASPTVTTTYTVAGLNSSGCGSNKTVIVKVNASPTVAVSPPLDSICTGSNVVLAATGATTYSWSPKTGLSATSGASVTATPSVNTTYTIVGTTGTCRDTIILPIVLRPLPVLTDSASSALICKVGNTVTISAGGASTYTWAPSASLSASTGSSVVATPSVTTTYTITGNNGTCKNTEKVVITVSSTPTVAVNPASGVMCTGGKVVLTGSGATTYSWAPNFDISDSVGASVTATPSVTTTYTVMGTKSGCTGSKTVVVTVNITPTVTASSTSDSLCNGSSVTLSGHGASTYSWAPTTGLANPTDSVTKATPTTTTKYVLTGTSSGCKDTISVRITVNPLPTLTVTPTAATMCTGDSVHLSISGANTYAWNPSTGLNNTTNSTVTDTGKVTETYTVTGTNIHGCSAVKTTKVTVVVTPTVTVTPDSSTICLGSKQVVKAAGATTYAWAPSTGLSGTAGTTVTATPTVSSTYTIVGSNGSGCIDSATFKINVVPAATASISGKDTVCAGTSTTLTASPGNSYVWNTGATTSSITVAPAITSTFTVTVSNGYCAATAKNVVKVDPLPVLSIKQIGDTLECIPTTLISYQWYYNGTLLPGETYDTIVMDKDGNYKVEATNANGCTDTVSKTIVNVGINEISYNQFVSIYPNPSTGMVQMQCDIPDGDYTLQVTDILGQVINKDVIHVAGKYSKTFDMTSYTSGIYIFTLRSANSETNKKVIITH